MCQPSDNADRKARRQTVYGSPEATLARELHKGLGLLVDASALAEFVRSRWSRVQYLAHAIHDTTPPSPAQ